MNEIEDKCKSFYPFPEIKNGVWTNLYTSIEEADSAMIEILVTAVEELQEAHNNLCDYVAKMETCKCQKSNS